MKFVYFGAWQVQMRTRALWHFAAASLEKTRADSGSSYAVLPSEAHESTQMEQAPLGMKVAAFAPAVVAVGAYYRPNRP